MQEEFETIVETIEAWQDSRAGIRERAAAWVASPLFLSTCYDNTHAPANLRDVLQPEIGARDAGRIWNTVRGLGIQSPDLLQKYRALSESGEVVFAQAVISNPGFSTMPGKSLPCLFLVPVQQDSAAVATAGILASALADLYLTGEGGKERPRTQKLVRDDDFHLLRRRPLPLDEVGGFAAILLDLQMRKSWMPPASLPFIPLLYSPEAGGGVVQIPWYVVMGESPDASDLETGVWHEIAEMGRAAPKGPSLRTGSAGVGTSSNRAPGQRPMTSSKPPSSFRLLLLRILSILMLLLSLGMVAITFLMASEKFDEGFLAGIQSAFLANHGIESWEQLKPELLGEMIGRQFFPLIFIVLATIAAFRRMRKTSIVSYAVLFLAQVGAGSLPLGSLAGLVLSSIPGRSKAWEQ